MVCIKFIEFDLIPLRIQKIFIEGDPKGTHKQKLNFLN